VLRNASKEIGDLLPMLFRQRDRRFLVLLLSADVVFVFLHLLHGIDTRFHLLGGYFGETRLSIGQQRGYAETFRYVKFFWTAVMVFGLWRRERVAPYLGWSILFWYFLADDSLMVHETLGSWIADALHFDAFVGRHAGSLGELVVSASVGIPLLTWIALGYGSIEDRHKKACVQFAILLAALVFFGIVIDDVHTALAGGSSPYLEALAGIVEDGGELVVASLLCWYAWLLVERGVPSVEPSHAPRDATNPAPYSGS
jgi:hypothetical protein